MHPSEGGGEPGSPVLSPPCGQDTRMEGVGIVTCCYETESPMAVFLCTPTPGAAASYHFVYSQGSVYILRSHFTRNLTKTWVFY